MTDYIRTNKSCYDALAREYRSRLLVNDAGESVKTLCDFVLNTMTTKGTESVLEIGPGAGETLAYYANLGFQTLGIELSNEMALVSKNTSPMSTILIGNVLDIDFCEESFDIIVMAAVIHLFPTEDALSLVKKAFKWLKPNGRLFINTTCSETSNEGFEEKLDYSIKAKRFRRHWQEKEFKNFIGLNKFDILDTMYTDEKKRNKRWVAYVCAKKNNS